MNVGREKDTAPLVAEMRAATQHCTPSDGVWVELLDEAADVIERLSVERDTALARAETAEAENRRLRGLLQSLYDVCAAKNTSIAEYRVAMANAAAAAASSEETEQ